MSIDTLTLRRSKRNRNKSDEILNTRKRFKDTVVIDDEIIDEEIIEEEIIEEETSEDVIYVSSDENISNLIDDNYYDNENIAFSHFDLDTKPIQREIIKGLVKGGVDSQIVQDLVTNTFRSTGELLNSFSGCKTSDNWILGVDDETIDKLKPEYDRLRKSIENDKITIPKILSANITKSDKKRCINMFDLLNNMEPYTESHDLLSTKIRNILGKSKHHTHEEVVFLEKAEKDLQKISEPLDTLKNQILKLNADDTVKSIIYGQYLNMIAHEIGSQAYNSLREEIEWSLKLPHKSVVPNSVILRNLPNNELSKCYQDFLVKMDQKLYGMYDIKLKMLHIINDSRRGQARSCRNIGINGPPGCGKTQIGKAMANVLGLPFEKISVGGMTDSTIFKGSDRVWSGASPSIILQKMAKMKSSGGVIMIDEIDKLGRTVKGQEVQDSILEISDPDHNSEFGDAYLNKYHHDLSGIFFIYCMNGTEGLTDAFKSRIDIHEVTPYNDDDKAVIIPKYVLPEALRDVGMNKTSVTLTDSSIRHIIKISASDPGIRTIQKIIKQIVGEINMYNSILLPNGSIDIDLGFVIPNFKLPIKIDKELLIKLLK